jgi:hypothetical protein
VSKTNVTYVAIIVNDAFNFAMIKNQRSFVSKNSNSLNALIKKTSMTIKPQNTNGKKLLMTIAASAVLLGGIFALGFGDDMIAFAAKPQSNGNGDDVIAKSNGFPSGPHFNLIIHGKKSFDPADCVGTGGKSVFTPLNSTEGAQATDQTLQMFANKKSSLTTLEVKDKCTEAFDSDPAQVQIPTKIETDEGLVDITDGMYVFARVHGTPNHGGPNGNVSSIALWPDPNIEACNLNSTATGDESDCFNSNGDKQDFVELGWVDKNGVYKCDDPGLDTCEDQGLVRYDDGTKGKGAKKAVDITPLFLWTGVGCIDPNDDGLITEDDFLDVDGSFTLNATDTLDGFAITQTHVDDAHQYVIDNTGVLGASEFDIDSNDEFEALLIILGQDVTFESCVFEEDTWVFDVFGADLVIQNQTLTNDGVKNLQIRFYPNQTTTYIPDGY